MGFSGGERRAWIYLNRVNRYGKEAMVLEHIRSKSGFDKEKIYGKEIPSDQNRLKCFVATTPLTRKV